MYHYIYKVTAPNGKFYVGRHSTNNLDDNYLGSGKWVRSIKDKTSLNKEIIMFCGEHELLEAERSIIEAVKDDSNNMNFNLSPIGFSTGQENPAKSDKQRKSTSDRVSGDGNPAKRKDVANKISNKLKSRFSDKTLHPRYGVKLEEDTKKKISDAHTGTKASLETKEKLSQLNRERVLSGNNPKLTMKNKNHTEEAKRNMSKAQLMRPKKSVPIVAKSSRSISLIGGMVIIVKNVIG